MTPENKIKENIETILEHRRKKRGFSDEKIIELFNNINELLSYKDNEYMQVLIKVLDREAKKIRSNENV